MNVKQASTVPAADNAELVRNIILDAARSAEFAISWARIIIVALMLARFMMLQPTFWACLIVLPAAAAAFLFSGVFITGKVPGRHLQRWLFLSVGLDCVLCTAVLANNIALPWEGFPGTLYLPDTAILLVVTIAAGFRLSLAIAIFGGLMNIASLLALLMWEAATQPAGFEQKSEALAMWLIMLAGTTIAAGISAVRTRSISLQSAQKSVRLHQMRDGVATLLQTHHDAHGLLSSVVLNAEMLIERVGSQDQEAKEIAEDLSADLNMVGGVLHNVKHGARGQLDAMTDPVAIDLGQQTDAMLKRLQPNFPEIEIVHDPVDGAMAVLAGGAPSLQRMLTNLVANAAQGNGLAAAQRIEVGIKVNGSGVALLTDDDGPGFSSAVIKPSGLGVGLESVKTIVQASGGKVEFAHSPLGGARIEVTLMQV